MNVTEINRASRQTGSQNTEERLRRLEELFALHVKSGGHRRIEGHVRNITVSASETVQIYYADRTRQTVVYKLTRKFDPAVPGKEIYREEIFYKNGKEDETYVYENWVYVLPAATPVSFDVRRVF